LHPHDQGDACRCALRQLHGLLGLDLYAYGRHPPHRPRPPGQTGAGMAAGTRHDASGGRRPAGQRLCRQRRQGPGQDGQQDGQQGQAKAGRGP
nr:hypothetical protein [Tanacetum cinerariifolium]